MKKRGLIVAGAIALGGLLLLQKSAQARGILQITWSQDGQIWYPITEPVPAYTYITYRFRVKNTEDSRAAFRIGYSWYSDFSEQWYWRYSPSVFIEPDTEGNIDWSLNTSPGTHIVTFYLFADDGVGGPEGKPGDALGSIKVTIVAV